MANKVQIVDLIYKIKRAASNSRSFFMSLFVTDEFPSALYPLYKQFLETKVEEEIIKVEEELSEITICFKRK